MSSYEKIYNKIKENTHNEEFKKDVLNIIISKNPNSYKKLNNDKDYYIDFSNLRSSTYKELSIYLEKNCKNNKPVKVEKDMSYELFADTKNNELKHKLTNSEKIVINKIKHHKELKKLKANLK